VSPGKGDIANHQRPCDASAPLREGGMATINQALPKNGRETRCRLRSGSVVERQSVCGISQKDGFACAFMDGALIGAKRRHEAAREIRPTHPF